MQKSKLITLLQRFSKTDMKEFGDFVSSPFFNKEKVLERLAAYLINHYPAYDTPGLVKESVFLHLYPGKKYSDGLMRNIISDLLNLAEEFLMIKNLDKDKFRKDMLLMNELKSRKLPNHFLKKKEKTEKLVEQSSAKDGFYYDKKTELNMLYSSFLKETEDTYIRENMLFQDTSDLITAGFLVKILYYNTYMLTRQSHIANFSFTLNFSGEIDIFLENEGKRFLEISHIGCYYFCFKLLQTNDEKYFYILKDFIKNNFNELDREERKSIQSVLENYCYSKVTQEELSLLKSSSSFISNQWKKGRTKELLIIFQIFFL